MKTETIALNEKGDVALTAYIQPVEGEFRGILDRPAVLVLPGGGYMFCSDREADPVAFPYLKAGYDVFILRYSVGPDHHWPEPLDDYEKAMELIESRAEEWHVCREKIAVIGFSAGGHLAGAAATMAKHRPAAAILGYAVLNDQAKELGEDLPNISEHVDEHTCPCFVFATRTDGVVKIQNSLDFLNALNRYGTSFETHIYSYGAHGFSTADHSVQSASSMITGRAQNWVEDSIGWLHEIFGEFGDDGMTKPAVKGHVNDDGEAWLSLDCTIGRVYGNPEARRVLADLFAEMEEKIPPFSPEMTFDDMMHTLSSYKLRELLCERDIEVDRFDEYDERLHKVPNI